MFHFQDKQYRVLWSADMYFLTLVLVFPLYKKN